MSVDPDVYHHLPDVVYQTSAVDLVGPPKYPDHQQLQDLVYIREPSAESRSFTNLQWMSPYVAAPAPAVYEDEGFSEDVSGCPVVSGYPVASGCPVVCGTRFDLEPNMPYESARFADFAHSSVGVIVGDGTMPSQYYNMEPLKTRKASAPASCKGGRKPKGKSQKPVPKAKAIKKGKDHRYTGSGGGTVEMTEEQIRAEIKRRASACVRERGRQVYIGAALDALRAVLPCCKPPGKKLTKIETLRLAIKYINHLQILNSEPPGSGTVPVGNCDLDLCQSQMRAAAPNYYNCYKQDIDHHTSYYSHQVQIVPPSELYWQADDNQSFVYHGTTWNNV